MHNERIKSIAKKWYIAQKFPAEIDREFYALLEALPDFPAIRICEFEDRRNDYDQQATFVLFLYFFEELAEEYKKRGISDKILYDSVHSIVSCSLRCKDTTGKIGLESDMADWMLLILNLKLFRFERYQFARSEAITDVPEYGLKKGDPVLDIHIPGGKKLSAEKCVEEMKEAEIFFKLHFPELEYRYFTCYSWLLDDTLKQYLDEESNILKFRNLFDIVHKDESDAIFKFMFRFRIKSREELSEWDAQTGFAKKIKISGINGTKFYEAYGIRSVE